jgi:mRNA interferase RelE/StbE
MQVEFLSKFNRDLDRIHHQSVRKSIIKVIDEIRVARTLNEVSNIKKLKGFRSAFRIRLGEYRIGIFVEGRTVEFARILHRKEIYRYFP